MHQHENNPQPLTSGVGVGGGGGFIMKIAPNHNLGGYITTKIVANLMDVCRMFYIRNITKCLVRFFLSAIFPICCVGCLLLAIFPSVGCL